MAQEGLDSTADWNASVELYVHRYLANSFGEAWWEELAREYFPKDFRDYVDQQLARGDRQDHHAYWLAVRSRVAESTGAGAGRQVDEAGQASVCDRIERQVMLYGLTSAA